VSLARKNIAPLLGSTILTKLRAEAVDAAYAKALTSGRRDGRGGLSPQTIIHMHRVLKEGHRTGGEMGIAPAQSDRSGLPPKASRSKMNTYDLDQTAELIDAMRPYPYACPDAARCSVRDAPRRNRCPALEER